MKKGMFVLAMVVMMALLTGISVANNGAQHASAALYNTDGEEIGFARFVEDATGRVHINVHVEGISPGLHGIHLHAVGRCEPSAFTSAGGHFNPEGRQHGLENPAGAHAGDLPNLKVNPAGVGRLNTKTEQATLSDGSATLFDADGSALVIHAGPDDQRTDPTGNSGGRIACGVIEEGK